MSLQAGSTGEQGPRRWARGSVDGEGFGSTGALGLKELASGQIREGGRARPKESP